MGYPVAAGVRDMGSTTMRYIPVLYSGKMLVKFYDKTILSMVTNTDYEGEIRKFGDTVYVRSVPTLTIRNYVKGQALVNEQPESTATSLTIDKGKYWSFVSEDLDKVQVDIKSYVNQWADDASEQMKITVDTDVLQAMPALVHASNTGNSAGVKSANIALGVAGASVALSKTNILEKIVDCGTVLDEQNIPDTGRFFIMPPSVIGMIKKSDLKDASLAGDPKSIIRNGVVGMIDRFLIINSNLLLSAAGSGGETGYTCISMLFGHKLATTFATQLTETKVIDNPDGFGMLHRGLQVYGYAVLKSEGLGRLYARLT